MVVYTLGKFIQQRRSASFTARVRAALAELGLQVSNFGSPLRRLFHDVCLKCHIEERDNANPYALASEFFLRMMIEYPHIASGAVMFQGALIESVGVLRSWHVKGRIEGERARASIEHIKRHLIEQLERLDLPDEARLETELQVREL